MSRRVIVVDRPKFEAAVVQAESGGPLANLSKLNEAIVAIYNSGEVPEPISPSVAGLRLRDFGISIKTVAGKRGRGTAPSAETIEKMRAARALSKGKKKKNHPDKELSLEAMRQTLIHNGAQRFLPLVERIGKGSSTAERKLGCLECVAYMPKEVRDCSDIGCVHWLRRPYQSLKSDSPEDIEAATVAEIAEVEAEDLAVA